MHLLESVYGSNGWDMRQIALNALLNKQVNPSILV